MIRQAHAKINLTLEVLGKRSDGYHEIRSVFRTLALHDTLHFAPAADVQVFCAVPELRTEQNLAARAARLLQQASGYRGGAAISIEKAIPIAAGLGGGSSDGAAALLGLDALWRTHLSAEELARLAAALGSDVPFFLLGGTARAEGRGETLHPLPALPDCPLLLVRPPIAVSTAAIYRMVTPDAYTEGAITARFAAQPAATPPQCWPLYNALQAFTCRAYPVVAEVLAALPAWGASQALMCGSGPTCFGLFAGEEAAQAAALRAGERGWESWVTHFR
ncbi:MAG TPA: 4-(cytidine 5'-diphospho)-2-C-methyl-D-erythritol kinase [Chloroflexota bacterium]|nr:4-(cytidine 5'-diphospho)-2-C-methyl-D-erythritol kinase [Chloroflexota bacterium]